MKELLGEYRIGMGWSREVGRDGSAVESVDPRAKDGTARRIGVVGWSDGPWLALRAVNPWKG